MRRSLARSASRSSPFFVGKLVHRESALCNSSFSCLSADSLERRHWIRSVAGMAGQTRPWCEPRLKGDCFQGDQAGLAAGRLGVRVPPFITEDEKIRVKTAEGAYQERAQAVVKPAAPGSLIIEMRVFCLTAFLCASAAFAQGFGQLATNKDGSTLYFSTPLRMKGSSQYLHPRIFTWDQTNGIGLYEQRPSDVPFPFPYFGFIGTQFFSLVAADLSSDGKTVEFREVCSAPLVWSSKVGSGSNEDSFQPIRRSVGAP
jgi:Elongation factor P, C-terminal